MRVLIVFFFVIISCNSADEKLPVLSYHLSANGIKNNYKVHYYNFKNQDDKHFTDEFIHNKVFIANFFFTRCPSICPPMRTQLIDIANSFAYYDNFLIISHTIDPKYDTPNILKSYSESTEISSNKWQFLNSTNENTKLLSQLYKTNFKPNKDGTDFYHSSYTALVDRNKYIRGFYNLAIPNEVKLLKKDIKLLLEN